MSRPDNETPENTEVNSLLVILKLPWNFFKTNIILFAAYEVLSDSEKRRVYDRTGSAGANAGPRAGNFHFNFDDLFKQFESDIFGTNPEMKGHFANHFSSHFESHFSSHAQNGMDIDIDSFFKVKSLKSL